MIILHGLYSPFYRSSMHYHTYTGENVPTPHLHTDTVYLYGMGVHCSFIDVPRTSAQVPRSTISKSSVWPTLEKIREALLCIGVLNDQVHVTKRAFPLILVGPGKHRQDYVHSFNRSGTAFQRASTKGSLLRIRMSHMTYRTTMWQLGRGSMGL